MKRNILFLLSLCMLLLTCSDGNDPIKEIEKPNVETKDPFITLKKTNIDFINEGGSEAISIESNVSWTAKSSASWCTVSPSSGNKSTTSITLTAPANEDYDNRSCTVTLESGNITKIITVNQGENLGLLVTQDRYELGNAESTIKVEVKANVEFEVEINDEWITRVETRGLSTSQIEFKIAENETYVNRDGSITIKQKGGNLTSTISIFQSQEDALILSEKDFDISREAQSVEVEVKTNIDYEIIIPEDAKDWVSHATTRALRTETVVLDVAENKEYDERTVEVIVKDKKTDLQDTITIIQALKEVFILSQKIYEVQSEGEAIIVDLNTNINFEYKISTDSDWIKPIKTRGLSNYKLNFTIEKNNIYNKREGFIEFYQIDGNISDTLWIKQLEKPDLGNGGKTNSFIISEEGLYRFSIGDYIGDKAFLLWNENGKDDIINVEHKNGYIYFEKKNFEKGNAMISLVKNGKIVWSWHIWSTDKPKTIEVNREKWMDRNLGATTTTPNDLDVYGLSYNPGNPFPFPGPKYEDYIITSSPSIPNGWYVASGYGFYKASNMPSPANPMQLCTNTDAYGNSDYFRLRYSQTPKGYYLPSVNIFQNILGYEPQLNNNGVYITEDLYVPCIYGNKPSNNYGLYLCAGVYNNVAVATYAIMFYEKVSKKTYTGGASLLPIRCYGY